MLPTQVLEEEHEVILKMIAVIRNLAKKIDAADPDILQKIIDFIRTFADHCHHAKEEKVLYVEAENQGIPRDGGPIGVMLMEHEEGRGYVKAMDEALNKIKQGDQKARQAYRENMLRYADLLEPHIGKENQILYPMINMHLPGDIQDEILKRFEKVEKEDVGEGVHDRYHKLVEELTTQFAK